VVIPKLVKLTSEVGHAKKGLRRESVSEGAWQEVIRRTEKKQLESFKLSELGSLTEQE
jgi:hypothetical protein